MAGGLALGFRRHARSSVQLDLSELLGSVLEQHRWYAHVFEQAVQLDWSVLCIRVLYAHADRVWGMCNGRSRFLRVVCVIDEGVGSALGHLRHARSSAQFDQIDLLGPVLEQHRRYAHTFD